MNRFHIKPIFWVSAMLLIWLSLLPAAAQEADLNYLGNPDYPAPEFPTGVDWINVDAPLTMADLRGKVVILDFWTYGCINCIHMIPTLKQLEASYGDALAVVGVHSAKFANEGQTDNIRQIVRRYGLEHPVINDSGFTVWDTFAPYGVQAWPSFVIIDPRGNLYAVQAGEIPLELFDQVIGGMIGYFDGLGEIDRTPLPVNLEAEAHPASALSFPGKVTVDTTGNRLFIADSSNNRIIIADLTSYEILDVIGRGSPGFDNGSYIEATFNKPQGMALVGDRLYVADTDNHAIRLVSLIDRTVTTAAGTGKQAFNPIGGAADTTDLSSPWDVELGENGELYIAMAGTHQIWEFRPTDNHIQPLIGGGREGLLDGQFYQAQLAQPSGLFYRDAVLYFADSESSSIRAANIGTQTVTTLAGPTSNDLFDYGDVDGGFGASRLQHTLGVVGGDDGLLYVADTYNSKIKMLNPETMEISTLTGAGSPGGYSDGELSAALFDEPGGLAFANGKLYVADTNNQAVRVIDLAAQTVSTIQFPNPEALQINGQITVVGGSRGVEINLPEQIVAPMDGLIVLNITLPDGYKLNPNIPFTAQWSSDGEAVQIEEGNATQSLPAPDMPITIPASFSEGKATVTGNLTIYYCEAVQESLCFIDEVTIHAPVDVTPIASNDAVQVERVITPPQVQSEGFQINR